MTHDVFISYSSLDGAVAQEVCRTLEKQGIRCWIAPRDVLPGTLYGEVLINAINTSRIVILILSANSNQSPQVIREVERAGSKGITIIPFRIEDVPLSKSMEFFISTHHWMDALSSPLDVHLARLVGTVKELLASPEQRRPLQDESESAAAFAAGPVIPKKHSRALRASLLVFSFLVLIAAGYFVVERMGSNKRAAEKPAPEAVKPAVQNPLPETPPPGTLEIDSIPPGANVYLENKLEGSTPFKRELPAGPYKIKLKKAPDYSDLTDVVEVTANKIFSKKYNLEILFILKISTKPEGAMVIIDEIPKGQTPLTLTLAVRSCHLKIEKDKDWSAVDEQIHLTPGQNSLSYDLSKRKFRLTIRTAPAEANVFLDGKTCGLSPMNESLLWGKHEVKIAKEGFRTIEESLDVESDFEKTYALQKLEAGKIRLKVQPYADVYIDGKLLGEVPPIRVKDLEEGKHTIEFVSPRLNKKFSVEIEVKAGESQEILMNMETGEKTIIKLNNREIGSGAEAAENKSEKSASWTSRQEEEGGRFCEL